jgi:nucleotide-binding universal stress UspA family protein
MISHILLADDGSENARLGGELLSQLRFPPGTEIDVLQVLNPRDMHGSSGKQLAAVQELQQLWEKPDLVEKGWQVIPHVEIGHPAEKIAALASQKKSELIVLGAQGKRAALQVLLGGVAQQVVEYTDQPVLVVRRRPDGLKKILFATDGSIHSERALDFLAELPLPQGIEVHLIHALPPIPPEVVVESWTTSPDVLMPLPPMMADVTTLQAEEEAHGKKLLEKAAQRLAEQPFTLETHLVTGDAGSEILEFVTQNQVDLVVSGSRGLSPVKSWLLGSVSRKLVHYASCSVLLVK